MTMTEAEVLQQLTGAALTQAAAAVKAIIDERNALKARCDRFDQIIDKSGIGVPESAATYRTIYSEMSHIQLAGTVRMLSSGDLHHEAIVCAARDRIVYLVDKLAKAEADAKAAKHDADMYANAWEREIGPPYVNKRHHIDAMVVTTQMVRAQAARVPILEARIAELERAEETKRLDAEYGRALQEG